MEKHAPPQAAAPKWAATHHRSRKLSTLVLAAVSIFWIYSSWRFLGFGVHSCWGAQPEEAWREYPGETVKWKLCGNITGHDVECSTIHVPMDQFNKENSGNKNFSIPLIRLRGKNATRNLLLNPGGPGGSGASLIYLDGGPLNTIVGEDFHLLSFDPRGVNQSRPLASCYPDAESRSRLAHAPLKDTVKDSPRMHAWTTNFVQSCKDNMGDHIKYLNTPQTAADMNSILDAVGQENMLYWGMSYGTVLGQVYATMYPERSERIIIDGVADQFEWFNNLTQPAGFTDTDRVYRGLLDECVKAGAACPLSRFAKSASELGEKVTRAINNLRSEPLPAYINTKVNGVLDDSDMWQNGVFRELYEPKRWPDLASLLANLLEGNVTDAFLAFGQGDIVSIHYSSDANNIIQLNDNPTGPEYWPQGRLPLLEKLLPMFDEHFFLKSEEGIYYMKQQWDIPSAHSYAPKKGVATAHPLLILSTTYDPICPLTSAKVARDAFKGSRIVEILGYGHCSMAMPSLCAGKYVRNYLLSGALPDTDVQCAVDEEYFPGNGKDKSTAAAKGYTTEELEIIKAQSQLHPVFDVI